MPVVPTLQNQISPNQLPDVQVRALQSNRSEAIGGALQNVSGVIADVQRQEQLKADQAAFMDADRATSTVQNELTAKARSTQLKDAIGVTPKTLEDFDKETAKIQGTLKTPRQKLAYQKSIDNRREQFQRELDSHEGHQREAYYAQSREDYKAQAHIDAVAHYQDPKAVESEIDKVRAVVAQTPGLDDAQRATELGVRRTGIYQGVIARYLANDQIAQAEKYYKSVKDGVNGDKAGAIENAIIDAKARVQAAQKAAAVTARASRILTLYQSDGPEAGAQALAALGKSGLPVDVVTEIYSKVQTATNQLRNAKQEEHADALAGISQRIAGGNASMEDMATIDALWKDNAFSPTERASMIGRVESSIVSHAGDQAAALAVREALNKGLPLDPTNPDHKKAVAKAFQEDSRETPVGSDAWQGLATAYATRTRVIPEQATSWVRAAIRSPDYKVAAPAAQFLGSIEASAPDAASGFDTNTKAFAGMVNSMIEGGTAPKIAIETARTNVYETKPAILEQRKIEYSGGSGSSASVKTDDSHARSSNNALDSFINRDFDTAFTLQPAAGAALSADFNSQAQKYYLKTGDITIARELAWTDLKRVYGPTEVNGVKEFTPLPPERFGVKPEEIRTDLAEFLKDSPQEDGSTAADVTLVPDSLTLRAVTSIMDGKPQLPTYKLVGKGGDLITDSKGIPVRYSLPNQDDLSARIKDQETAARELAQKQIEQARFDREDRRTRREQLSQGELR